MLCFLTTPGTHRSGSRKFSKLDPLIAVLKSHLLLRIENNLPHLSRNLYIYFCFTLTDTQISNPMLLGVSANWMSEAFLSISAHQAKTQ